MPELKPVLFITSTLFFIPCYSLHTNHAPSHFTTTFLKISEIAIFYHLGYEMPLIIACRSHIEKTCFVTGFM